MIDFSLGYVLDGRHYGTGVGIGKLPEAFAVREHVEDGGYVETLYVPEMTCNPVYDEQIVNHGKFDAYTCDICGDYFAMFGYVRPRFCPSCGARVERRVMSYRCIRELKVEATTIPVDIVIGHVGHDSIRGRAFVTFAIGFEHYAMEAEAFKEHFEEVVE